MLTQKSSDGGVDVITDRFDPNLKTWIRTVIQVKRYKTNIGISPIRELNGVLSNHNASFGCLVTLSGFKRGVKETAMKDFPKISLLSGPEFKELLKKSCLIDSDDTILFIDNPNLEKNVKKSILNFLRNSKPKIISIKSILEHLKEVCFVTISDNSIEECIQRLKEIGEVISIENGFQVPPKPSEIQIIHSKLPRIIETLDYFFSKDDVNSIVERFFVINRIVVDRYLKISIGEILSKLLKKDVIRYVNENLFGAKRAIDNFRISSLDTEVIRENVKKIIGYKESDSELLVKNSKFYPTKEDQKVISGVDKSGKKILPFLQLVFFKCPNCSKLHISIFDIIVLYVTTSEIEFKLNDLKDDYSHVEFVEGISNRFELSSIFTKKFYDCFEKYFGDIKTASYKINRSRPDVLIQIILDINEDSTMKDFCDKFASISDKFQRFSNELFGPVKNFGKPSQVYHATTKKGV
jgi:hypothetical protein